MSKNYLCKDCKNNNNGWCTARKIQGLKSITECSVIEKDVADLELINDTNEDVIQMSARRELLFFLQRQFLGLRKSKESINGNDFVDILNMAEEYISHQEGAKGLTIEDYESTVDRDIYEATKQFKGGI